MVVGGFPQKPMPKDHIPISVFYAELMPFLEQPHDFDKLFHTTSLKHKRWQGKQRQ